MEFIMCGEILDKWMEYKNRFYDVGKNILNSKIFENEMDRVGRNYRVNTVFTRERLNEVTGNVRDIRCSQLLIDNRVVMDKTGMERVLNNLGLSMVEFFRLKAVMFRLKERMQSEGILSRKINTILKSKKKGSGILRREICGKESKEYLQYIGNLRREICGKESKEYLHWEFNRLNCITVLLENQGEVDRTKNLATA